MSAEFAVIPTSLQTNTCASSGLLIYVVARVAPMLEGARGCCSQGCTMCNLSPNSLSQMAMDDNEYDTSEWSDARGGHAGTQLPRQAQDGPRQARKGPAHTGLRGGRKTNLELG